MAEQRTHNYHPLDKPTAAWQKLVEELDKHATETASARADRDRDRRAAAIRIREEKYGT